MRKLVPLFLLLSACTSQNLRAPSSVNETHGAEPLKIIDAHTHASFTNATEPLSGIPYTRAEYLRQFQEAGVVGAVAHTAPENQQVDESLAQAGIVHCLGVSAKPSPRPTEAALKTGRYSCIKIYLGYFHQYAFDKNYEPVYQLAKKYDVPVVFHTGDTDTASGKVKYADPLTLDEVAVDHRNVKFVIAHCGNPWHASAAEVAYKNPNVYIECSGMMIGDLSTHSPEEIDRYVTKPIAWIFGYVSDPKKFMFGTDWPLVNIKQYLEVYKRAIPPQHWQAVFHDNAAELFKMKNAKL
jgi:predicted TIM-barrel fold metal-dependent hydrolase